MSTAWTLAASDICTDALEHLGVIADGETASGGDMQLALKALNGVLKELPLHGYAWPALSAEVALTWAGVQALALPVDYYAYPMAWKTVNGFKSPLLPIPHAQWVQMTDRTATGTTTHFYISPAGELLVYPVPDVDPVITLQYQKIVPDAALTTAPVLPQYWLNPLGYGVANELSLKFSLPSDRRVEIAQRWGAKRDRALEHSIASEVISFEVRE